MTMVFCVSLSNSPTLVKFMQRQISREFMGFFKIKEIEGDVRKLTSDETSEIRSKTKL